MKSKFMFVGDTHGNIKHWSYLMGTAFNNKVTDIIVCGDFGYWPHMSWGIDYLNLVAKLAKLNNIHVWWVDGNHDNHDLLDRLVAKHGSDKPIETPNEWVKWIPRGCRFEINGWKMMGYGGAWSVDWEDRELGISYWDQEMIDPEHLDSVSDEEVDILITHEAPFGYDLSYKDDIAISVGQRLLIEDLNKKVKPFLHVCGHHHVRAEWAIDGCSVNVLGKDGMYEESFMIYEATRATDIIEDALNNPKSIIHLLDKEDYSELADKV